MAWWWVFDGLREAGMTDTTIEWTQKSWNPARGCARVSAGCEHCYAENMAHRFSGKNQPYEGLTVLGKHGPRWKGEARFVPELLGLPLRTKKPALWFVNSMSDLFHVDLTNEQIAAVFGVMGACPQHTFQVLTKRPDRMVEWFRWASGRPGFSDRAWPLPNVWLGVSVENQEAADRRIPLLLEVPAVVRWVSAEPLLGPIDMDMARCDVCGEASDAESDDGMPWCTEHDEECSFGHWLDFPIEEENGGGANGRISWVVVGGESGPGARPCEVGWIRDIVNQCRDAGTAVFVKQLGAAAKLASRKGGDMAEWPEDLRIRQMPLVHLQPSNS